MILSEMSLRDLKEYKNIVENSITAIGNVIKKHCKDDGQITKSLELLDSLLWEEIYERNKEYYDNKYLTKQEG